MIRTLRTIIVCSGLALVSGGCAPSSPAIGAAPRTVNNASNAQPSAGPVGRGSRLIVILYLATPLDNDCRNESKEFVRKTVVPWIGPSDEVCWISARETFQPQRDVFAAAMPGLPESVFRDGQILTPKSLLDQRSMQRTLSARWQEVRRQEKSLDTRIGGRVDASELARLRATVKPLDYALRRLSTSNSERKYLIILGNAQTPSFPDRIPKLDAVISLFAVYSGLSEFNVAKSRLESAYTKMGAGHFVIADKAESSERATVSRLLTSAGLGPSAEPFRVPVPEGLRGN